MEGRALITAFACDLDEVRHLVGCLPGQKINDKGPCICFNHRLLRSLGGQAREEEDRHEGAKTGGRKRHVFTILDAYQM